MAHIYSNGVMFRNNEGGLGVNPEGVVIANNNTKIVVTSDNIFLGFKNSEGVSVVVPKTITINGQKMTILTLSGYYEIS
jgi:hypothetical protein